jgi:peptidyl-prolyl cis-trans isomerase D
MLQEMRQYTKSWLSWLFVIPLVVSFAAWGINDVFRPATNDNVATVGGTDVSSQEFQRQYRLRVRELGMRRNEPITPEAARAMGVGKTLLDNVTAQTALDNLASQLGLGVSDAEVTNQIRSMREFAGPLGNFDRQTFTQKITELGYNEQGFIAQMHRDLALQQLIIPVQSAFQTPDGYFEALVAAETEQRAVEYLIVTPAMLPPIASPSDAVLETYLRAHASKFSTPEYRDVTFAYISPDDVTGQLNVTPEQIKQQYDANAATYVVPEKRDLEQLSFSSEADARAARTKIDSGQSFSQVATSLGKKQSDISIGTLTQKDLQDARGPAAFAMPESGVTQPVQTSFGWFLLHVTKVTAGHATTLDQATPEIRKSLLAQMAGAKIADMMNAAQDVLGTGAEIQEAAAKSGMHYAHVSAIDKSGLGSDGKPTATPNDPEFRSEVFKKEVGEYGDPEQAKSGLAFVIKVNGVTPPKLKALDGVRAEVVAAWTADQQAAQLRAKAQSLAAQAGKSPDLSSVAQSLGTKVATSPALSRTTADATFSKPLVEAIFNAAPGAPTAGPLGDGKGYVVARVTGIRHTGLGPDSPLFQRVRAGLSSQMGEDIALAMAGAAKAKQGVTVHPEVVNRVVGGENS